MATFYIDPSLNADGDGSFETPFNTWQSVTWTAGNTYLQKENTVYIGSLLPDTTGTVSAYIVLSVYDASSGNQIKRKTNTIVDANGADYCFFVDSNTSYFIVQGFTLQNAVLAGVKKETTSNSSSANAYVKTYDCIIRNIYSSTADLGHGCLLYGKGNEVKRCVISNISTDGIISFGDNLIITDCKITNVNTQGSANSGDCISAYDGNNIYVARNYLDTTNVTNKQCIIVRDIASGSSFGSIEDNICIIPEFANGAGASGKNIMVEQAGMRVCRNIVVGGEFGIWLQKTNIKCYSNLVISNSSVLDAAIAIRANDISVVNNTLIGNQQGATGFGYGISHNSGYTNTIIKNNLIINYLRAIRTNTTGATEDYNWLYKNTQPVVNSSNVNKTAGTNTSIDVDPILDINFYPKSVSPLVSAGEFVFQTTDLNGYFRTNPPSIGAYDRQAYRGSR